jgi:hypothetical protein
VDVRSLCGVEGSNARSEQRLMVDGDDSERDAGQKEDATTGVWHVMSNVVVETSICEWGE